MYPFYRLLHSVSDNCVKRISNVQIIADLYKPRVSVVVRNHVTNSWRKNVKTEVKNVILTTIKFEIIICNLNCKFGIYHCISFMNYIHKLISYLSLNTISSSLSGWAASAISRIMQIAAIVETGNHIWSW